MQRPGRCSFPVPPPSPRPLHSPGSVPKATVPNRAVPVTSPPGLCSHAHAGPAARCTLPTCIPAHSAGHLCSRPAHTLVLLAIPASPAGYLPPLDITPQLLQPRAASPPWAVPGSCSSAVLCLGRGPPDPRGWGALRGHLQALHSGAIASPQLCQLLAAACWLAGVPMSLVLTIRPSASPSVSPQCPLRL